ncbi:protein containing Helicase and RNase D [Candidatus Magnetomorum sp. HK-1]|nr:protein containing Helicase and RNase D [Candidatus Magnetomorum sp. HK-1]
MSIQYKFFWISPDNSHHMETELNQFLNSIQVISVDRKFVTNGSKSQFCIIIEYMSKQSPEKQSNTAKRIDYREVLSPEDFSLYATIRDWRKETAKKNGLQLYSILNNEQMANIAQNKITTKEGLQTVDGFGKTRMENYGDDIIKIVKKAIGSKKEQLRLTG